MVGQGSKYPQHLAVGTTHAVEKLELSIVGFVVRDGMNTGIIESHGCR